MDVKMHFAGIDKWPDAVQPSPRPQQALPSVVSCFRAVNHSVGGVLAVMRAVHVFCLLNPQPGYSVAFFMMFWR